MRQSLAFSASRFLDRLQTLANLPLRAVGLAVDFLLDGMERYRERQALRALPDYLLKDIGITRLDAEREAQKPFWKP